LSSVVLWCEFVSASFICIEVYVIILYIFQAVVVPVVVPVVVLLFWILYRFLKVTLLFQVS